MSDDKKPAVNGLPQQTTNQFSDVKPGNIRIFRWRKDLRKVKTDLGGVGSIQITSSVEKPLLDQATRNLKEGSGDSSKGRFFADVAQRISSSAFCNDVMKDGEILKDDATFLVRTLIDGISNDKELEIDLHALNTELHWLINQHKAGISVKTELSELRAMMKHAAAIAAPKVSVPASTGEAAEGHAE